MRGPGLRPPDLRLLGGRRPRLEGEPRRLARGGASRPAAAPVDRRPTRSRRTTPTKRSTRSRRSGARQPAFNPFAERRRPARRQPVRPDAPGPADGRRRCAAQADAARPRAGASSAATRRCCSTVTRPRPTPSSGRCRPTRGRSACATSTRNCPTRRCRRSSPASRRPRPAAHRGHARALVDAVCDDLASGAGSRPSRRTRSADTRPDATSAATPEFWLSAGFRIAVDDERFPVVRREL